MATENVLERRGTGLTDIHKVSCLSPQFSAFPGLQGPWGSTDVELKPLHSDLFREFICVTPPGALVTGLPPSLQVPVSQKGH